MQIEANENYVDSGPPFLILLHPALGPLWEVTKQKVTLYYYVIFSIRSSIIVNFMLYCLYKF